MELDAASQSDNELFSLLSWLDWLGLAVALLLIGLLAFLIWRRMHAGGEDKLLMPAAISIPEKLELPADRLSKVWRGFVSAIPWRLRPAALSAPLSLVIGDAGSGKTGIIDRYAHWQGQNYLFHPSAVSDPLLQIYLGAKSLVLEFGAPLLYDTHPAAFRALKKLWRRLPPKPQAVMVIDAGSLLAPQTELLRQSGHALFGKLKVFGKLEGKPLPLVLALSHMEQVEGFIEFCAFLQEAGIPLQIDFPQQDGVERLKTCLDDYRRHLPRALLNCSAQDYLKIVAFLNQAPRLFDVLLDFLRVSGLEQGLEAPPVVRLCLLSDQAQSFGCQPFAPRTGDVRQPLINLNFHAKTALVIFALGLFYLVGSYSYQQDMIAAVRQGIETVAKTPVEHYPEKINPLFLDFSADLHKDPLLTFMPNFFVEVDAFNKYLLIVEIRKHYLLPMLKQIQFEKDASFKTTRFVGMLYATPNNEIGKILAKHPEKNPLDMAKFGMLVNDYVKYNTHTEELDLPLNEMPFTKPETYIEDHSPWLALFRSYQQLLKKPFIQEAEFAALQKQLAPFMDVMDRLEYFSEQAEIRQWLMQHTSVRLDNEIQSELHQKSILQLLTLVANLRLNNAENCAVNLSLNECLAQVQVLANVKPDNNASELAITLDGERFSFMPAQWSALMTRSRISMILRNLMQNRRINDGWVFFGSPSIYPDVELNGSNNGELIFAGKARIDGRLTVDAFEQKVKPAVAGWTEMAANLPIDELEKKHFTDFVLKNLNAYADNYANSYLNYFRQFKINIDSVWAMNFVLDDLQLPNSQLLQVLVQIKTNTALNLPATPAYQNFAQKLAAFAFIQHLMEEKSGAYPELQKYQFMMAQMHQETDSTEPYTPKKPADNAAALKGAMTPLARVAWAMRLEEDGSYLKLVKSWLQSAGIPEHWQQPFLAPVHKVLEFGTTEINQHVDGIWNDLWDSNVAPLMQKFPFAPMAGQDRELSQEELIKVFHPKSGVFWVTFNEYLSPLSRFSNGVWIRPYELSDGLMLPANFLERVNAVQQLSASLWDAQGNPKPLELLVKPGLLPTFDPRQIPRAPLVSLAYLRNGGASVLGFNQHADWQRLPLEWWTGQPAEVGMEFRKDAAPARVYANQSTTDSAWNFFRLLQEAERAGLTYSWLLAHPDFPQQPLNLEFSFQSNPLAVFANLAGR